MNLTRPLALKTLRRRLAHLEAHVDERGHEASGASYDINEIKSLRWALGVLEPMVEADDLRTRMNGGHVHSMWEPDVEALQG